MREKINFKRKYSGPLTGNKYRGYYMNKGNKFPRGTGRQNEIYQVTISLFGLLFSPSRIC
jgi:hypothetical protein